ncbi:unnamed protein product [Knipowitschia caucasica]
MMMFLTTWMLLLSLCHGSFNIDLSKTDFIYLEYGETAVLSCHSSATLDEDAEVVWEAWGTKLASATTAGRTIAHQYNKHVRFASDLTGNWSLVIDSVILSDSALYECLQEGKKILAVTWLQVQPPQVDSVMEVYPDNTPVTLPCYLHLSRNQDLDELNVWWEKDGKILLERVDGEVTEHSEGWPNPEYENFHNYDQNLDRFPYSLSQSSDFGEYNCWYRTKQSEKAKPGIPGTIKVIFKYFIYDSENENNTENATEESGSTFSGIVPFELDIEETTTSEMPIFVNTVTAVMEVSSSTETLPMEAQEETFTSFPHEDVDEEEEDSVDWSDFPWVRIGLIAAVLSATALVLCILGLLHKL